MKKIFIIFISLVFFCLPPLALAGDYGLNEARDQTTLPQGQGAQPSDSIAISLGQILGALLAFLGAVFLILMIAGGVIWMTAAGNEKKLATARGLITAAIIGLIIVMAAYAITSFISTNMLPR